MQRSITKRIAGSAIFMLAIAGGSGLSAQSLTIAGEPPVTPTISASCSTVPKKADADASVVHVRETAPETKESANAADILARPSAAEVAVESEVKVNSPSAPPQNPPADDPTDRWQFQLTPYFWLAGLHGTVGTENRPAGVDMSFRDVWHNLKFAFMGTFEARRNKIGIVTDLQYVSLKDDKATPGPFFSNVEARVKTFIFDPEVAYRVYSNPEKGAYVDLMGGVRVVRVRTELTFLPGILMGTEVDGQRTWADAVAGLRAKAHLSPRIFVTGKFDLGGGGSKFTYQLFGAFGFEVNKSIALIAGYRDLAINYRRDNFVYDTSQRGPIFGVGFRF